ncbi:MAG: hypothetical protein NVS4B7_19570 [Ktedonobacteraceae bacterium]
MEVLQLNLNLYQSLGVFRGKALLPSQVLPGFPTQVGAFFS